MSQRQHPKNPANKANKLNYTFRKYKAKSFYIICLWIISLEPSTYFFLSERQPRFICRERINIRRKHIFT